MKGEKEQMERIHVSVRPRPLSAEDAKSSPWRISGNSIFISNQPTKFEFDQIFGEECKTQDVYRARTGDIVAAAVRGFNGTVFAYGQTSSGKTHTMRGSSSEPGVIPLAVHDLFNTIQQEMGREFLLRMSYMEIYNEEINDLLNPERRKLQIHENIERGIFVGGLREEVVSSAEQVLDLMEFGESHRHIGETNMNVYSSRSHTIFRMVIESREKTDDPEAGLSCDAVRVSVLNLVDLAGSERAAKTGAEGVRLKEGSHINKSLMTLGTVIKKLSEGAESQGGHVPYRDSKLTRILQPALGGNANTAIICNITLAQIHADETKSSLQFASRALRVTNCAHVNEILTDAALLKRQKKEIEELRAKLQGLHSEHLEEEILNLRNILLKSELELEERKRVQAEKEKRLQERIENLSSMVFCASREESSDVYKKAKRRDTWCPGNLGKKKLKELPSVVKEKSSEMKSTRADRKVGPLVPFEDLVEETSNALVEDLVEDNDCKRSLLEDSTIPDQHALVHITKRRKVPPRQRSLTMENNELAKMQAEYDNLLLQFETHRITSDIKIDCLMGKLAEADLVVDEQCTDGNSSLSGSDAILVIKQLQEKIAVLEMEKSSSQQKFDCALDLATKKTVSAEEKCEKLYEELMLARKEATLALDAHTSPKSSMEESDWLISLSTEAQEIKLEMENSRHLTESLSSIVDELLCFSSVMRDRIRELVDEKLVLNNQTSELRSRLEELSLEVQNSADAFRELNEKHEVENSEFLYQIQMLQRENLSLSACSLAKEKESIRKDLEKTKTKLKDTEFKLKNSVQEKTKLEGEKSYAEREVKRLQSQKAMLERDMSKREPTIGRRRDSTIDRSSNIFDQKRPKGSTALAELEEEYKNLEVLAFQMETTIASLEDQLAAANEEKDAASSRAESLASDLQGLSDELQLSNSELKEEVSSLRIRLEESRIHAKGMESSLNLLLEEKEELSMQLTDALLTMEEEKAIWSSKEKASVEVIEEKEKLFTAEIASLSQELSEARHELEVCRKSCKDSQEILDRQLDSKCQKACEEIETLQLELSVLRKEKQFLSAQVQELEARQSDESEVLILKQEVQQQIEGRKIMEENMHKDEVINGKEKAKLRMRLEGAQSKLDNYRVRYKESVDELDYMNKKFEAASMKLKKQLALYGTEVLNLKKQLSVLQGQSQSTS